MLASFIFPSSQHFFRLKSIVVSEGLNQRKISSESFLAFLLILNKIRYFIKKVIFQRIQEPVFKVLELSLVGLFDDMAFDKFLHILSHIKISLFEDRSFHGWSSGDGLVILRLFVVDEQHFIFIEFVSDKNDYSEFSFGIVPLAFESKKLFMAVSQVHDLWFVGHVVLILVFDLNLLGQSVGFLNVVVVSLELDVSGEGGGKVELDFLPVSCDLAETSVRYL